MSGCPVSQGRVLLHGPEFQTHPAGLYRLMRAGHGPVVPVYMDGDVPAWLVVGYRELHRVLTESDVFRRSSRNWNAWDRVPADWPLLPLVMRLPTVLYSEGEEHRRKAGALADALSGVDAHELRTVTTRMADRLIDAFCASDAADLRASYTARLPALVLGWMYGLDDDHGTHLGRLMTTMIDGGSEAMSAQQSLMALLGEIVARRRRHPGPDVVSRLLAHPAGYTDEEAIPELIVLLGGGGQPTSEWLGNALRLMLTDDRFAASIAGARSSVRDALNEVLWEDTPTQIQAGRYAAHDVELGGRLIRRGDMLLLGLAAANRDPEVRPGSTTAAGHGNHAHLSFSHGRHRCPYPAQEIAETIAVTGIEVLMDRVPDVELAVPAERLRWRPSPWVRGVTALPVTFTPTPPRGDH
ncbi:cytochrome P450 [Nocardiopsis sp. MG754419]|uniref:cytochrome P450 n=1 Tax=Nocardiopsis sp. MG754419 TaxID=2259865 RepID=UPI001BAC092D|nr:cytochrome P450 [Nocardiopsis sp. MG754419]MBR8743726.1 cytochrome P450 [Nocardiopsis sp. MG754419]